MLFKYYLQCSVSYCHHLHKCEIQCVRHLNLKKTKAVYFDICRGNLNVDKIGVWKNFANRIFLYSRNIHQQIIYKTRHNSHHCMVEKAHFWPIRTMVGPQNATDYCPGSPFCSFLVAFWNSEYQRSTVT